MTDPAEYVMQTPSTWARDLGALRAVADWEAMSLSKGRFGSAREVAGATGVDEELLRESLERWEHVSPPVLAGSNGTMQDVIFLGLSDHGRRLVGLWPSPDNMVDRLVEALELASESEPDEGKKSRLKTAALVIGTLARDVAVGAAGQALGGVM